MTESLTLLDFNRRIKDLLEGNLHSYYWVMAEIAGMQVNQRGHCYMELVQKEENSIVAKSRATIWAGQYAGISKEFQQLTGERLKSGLHILCCLKVNFHEVYGLSYNIVKIDPSYTLGERARRRKEVIERLVAENLVEKNSTLPLARIPQTIAVISSPTAAGWEDFTNQLSHNEWGYAVSYELFKASMQGEEAVDSIIDALGRIHASEVIFDLIVIIRGGGSELDLDCFDSYDLAREIAYSRIPVLTGIGHQRDDTVVDIVAHTRVKTPTAAAEFILDQFLSYEEELLGVLDSIREITVTSVHRAKEQLTRFSIQLNRICQLRMESERRNIYLTDEKMKSAARNALATLKHKLEIWEQKAEANHPERILQKGYSITRINGRVLDNNTPIENGDLLETETKDFVITSKTLERSNKTHG